MSPRHLHTLSRARVLSIVLRLTAARGAHTLPLPPPPARHPARTDIPVSSVYISTWFGGADSSWATPVDTFTLYRNIKCVMWRAAGRGPTRGGAPPPCTTHPSSHALPCPSLLTPQRRAFRGLRPGGRAARVGGRDRPRERRELEGEQQEDDPSGLDD